MKLRSQFAQVLSATALSALVASAGETPVDLGAFANEPWTFVGPTIF